MKKFLSFCLALMMVCCLCLSSLTAGAVSFTPGFDIHSAAGLVINLDTGEVIYQKNADTQYMPGSLVQIMAAVIVLENCQNLSTSITADPALYESLKTTEYPEDVRYADIVGGDMLSVEELLYAMMRCDSRRYWAALRNYVKLHLDETFPLHAEEAYILYMDKAPEEKRMMLPVEKSVYERYKQFWATLESHAKPGMTIEEVGEMMRAEYGDTYWWYNIFGRKIPVINGNIGHEVHS